MLPDLTYLMVQPAAPPDMVSADAKRTPRPEPRNCWLGTAGERDAWLKAHPEAVTWHLATRLLDVARTELDRDPREAEAVTGLVIRNLDRFAVPAEHAPLAAQFRSMTWRERGNAVRILGELPAARHAFEQALRAASDNPALRLDAAMARRHG